jgi:hypothetical protein
MQFRVSFYEGLAAGCPLARKTNEPRSPDDTLRSFSIISASQLPDRARLSLHLILVSSDVRNTYPPDIRIMFPLALSAAYALALMTSWSSSSQALAAPSQATENRHVFARQGAHSRLSPYQTSANPGRWHSCRMVVSLSLKKEAHYVRTTPKVPRRAGLPACLGSGAADKVDSATSPYTRSSPKISTSTSALLSRVMATPPARQLRGQILALG